jgi:hypothetical protein
MSSVTAPLLQRKTYAGVPPVTARLTAPVLSLKQATFVIVVDAEGESLTVIVKGKEVAEVPEMQAASEVTVTVTTSLLTGT